MVVHDCFRESVFGFMMFRGFMMFHLSTPGSAPNVAPFFANSPAGSRSELHQAPGGPLRLLGLIDTSTTAFLAGRSWHTGDARCHSPWYLTGFLRSILAFRSAEAPQLLQKVIGGIRSGRSRSLHKAAEEWRCSLAVACTLGMVEFGRDQLRAGQRQRF